MTQSLVWIRRTLRLTENKVIAKALENSEKIKLCFVFDPEILNYFPNKQDRRLSFIVNHLEQINQDLGRHNASIQILFGKPEEQIPNFASNNGFTQVFCDADFEPSSKTRDEKVAKALGNLNIKFHQVLDHLLMHPSSIKKQDGTAYKVFTPFMKHFRSLINAQILQAPIYALEERLVPGLNNFDKINILQKAAYEYRDDPLWHPLKAYSTFANFLENKIVVYHENRNLLYGNNTSTISPYLRFGALSITDCFARSLDKEVHPSFVNELIWREFYAYIMYWFPDSIGSEFQVKYRGTIKWQFDENLLHKFKKGLTGFPVVDAAVRQLLETGWMHNRARMIVASFFTKNLFFDWRIGEEFFSQYLMDYDLASNACGWQWTASVGTDAQPYFRVFNPVAQGINFDPNGEYVKQFVPELRDVNISDIHDPESLKKYHGIKYNAPIVDYKTSRKYAIETFRQIT
ncbi:MAG: deoxyribodipyrimidine photo-lyase [Rickettsiaceae bacterium]|nr:deoxyribodipyrimidine photo-lyase [Rickettsiaceae bacterium]